MEHSKDYSSYTLPPHRGGSSKYASPVLIPLVADSIISTGKSRPTSVEPPGYSALSDLSSVSPKSKFRYGLQSLGLACIAASFFTYVSVSRIDSLERLTQNISSLPRNHISRITWEASMSISLATMLSSIATFFISTLQLFFSLKIAKSNPGSPTLALQFLQDGKLVRLPTFFIFFLTILLFLLTNVIALILIPTPLGVLPKGVTCAVGISLFVFCAFATMHSLHLFFRMDDVSIGRSDGFSPSALKSQQHYSTLV